MNSTEIVPLSINENDILNYPSFIRRIMLRKMSASEWIDAHASGTLRKNKSLNFAWMDQYLSERIAYEFGWGFEIIPASRVTCGVPYTEGDCHSITEAGWHIERYITLQFFDEDVYTAKYIQVEYPDGTKKEGIGIVVEKTSAEWIGNGKIVFAIIAEYKSSWLPASNPF